MNYKAKKAEKRNRILLEAEGTVQMTREGYVFVKPTKVFDKQGNPATLPEGTDIFVKSVKTRGALNGDTVKVAITRLPQQGGTGSSDGASSRKGLASTSSKSTRCEGVITNLLERSRKPFVGFLHLVGSQAWVIMESKVMPYDIRLEDWPKEAKQGYKVAALVDDWPRGEHNPLGHIVDVLGAPGENDTEMHAILAEFGLPYKFESYIEKAAEKIPTEITETDISERRDFRKTLTFTIDPSDAKDFDDALSFKELKNGNYEVGVHIADVSHYVQPGTVIDKEARERGTSVYLVDRTVPMLPEKLCNNLCSLRPDEDKLTFSAVFELTPEAKIVDRWFGRTIIRSDRRFDYDQAQAIIKPGAIVPEITTGAHTDSNATGNNDLSTSATAKPSPAKSKKQDPMDHALLTLWSLAEKLRSRRFEEGAVSFERPEMKVLCDEKGHPVDIIRKISFEANWLIEEFMLLANRSVAEFVALKCHNKPFVYRVHDLPNTDKIGNLRTFVKTFGYKMPADLSGDKVARALNELFEKCKDTPEASAIELMSLRCMSKAKYDVDNIGHYGLAFKYYTHFTSPIRRYPDMMVHRLLAGYLAGGHAADKERYSKECIHASEREQLASDAERASIKYKMVEYMQDKVGYTFKGSVSGLTEWGMFVEVEPSHVEGLVPLRNIKSDYFEFDEQRYRLRGRHTRKTYTMGSPVTIRVVRADLDQKMIDFELVEN